MATSTPVLTARTIVPLTTRAAASAATRGTIDLRTRHGGTLFLTIKNNGALGNQCVCKVMAAVNDGATPAAGAEGTVWKLIWTFGGGTVVGSTTQSMDIGPRHHLQIEFDGNTTNSCGVEALFSEITSYTTV